MGMLGDYKGVANVQTFPGNQDTFEELYLGFYQRTNKILPL